MTDIIWWSTVDNNTWKVQVVRSGDYTGTLEIYRVENNKKMFSQDVHLAYRALFGPDVADVSEWQRIAIDFIDSQEEGAK